MTIAGGMRKEERARARPLLRLSCGCNEMSFVLFPPIIVDDGRSGLRGHTALMMRRNLPMHRQRSERSVEADHLDDI